MDKKIFQKKIGQNIARIRKRKGLTQSVLAWRIDKDRQEIHRAEKGNFNLTVYFLFQISQGLEVKLETLVKIK